MFLALARWAFRQVLGIIIVIIGLVGLLIWLLKWVPLPPVAVVVSFFQGSLPKWSWSSQSEHPPYLRRGIIWAETQKLRNDSPSLAQRTAELLFYPTGTPKWGSSLIGALLEYFWNEERITTFYLNAIPYDKDTYGIKAASLQLFSKVPSALTQEEAAELIARRHWPHLSKPLPPWLYSEYKRILHYLSQDSLHQHGTQTKNL
ncbi:MAG: transglycosylase domain-containing protein [Bacteroidia bacterium]|nr:transglycosylase domain-containing protein [Bacteroidia bacterium]MDW8133674.1 transglycosylase domain-containing protein [Bacteroidia bacterium]